MGSEAKTAVAVESILMQLDGVPELVFARDVSGGGYLCVLTDVGTRGYHFVGVPVSDARLLDLRTGAIDLRTVFTSPERPLRFAGCWSGGADRMIELAQVESFQDEWLPLEGFYLDRFAEGDASADET